MGNSMDNRGNLWYLISSYVKEKAKMAVKAYEHIRHEFEPVYTQDARILILGSLPSVKSRENHFYYGHPQNRFWKVMAQVFQEKNPLQTIEEKTLFLNRNQIALWDVIEECDIIGSSDSSIRNVIPTDVVGLLQKTKINSIYANGNVAYSLYRKYMLEQTNREIIKLPSTSPANAAFSLERLVQIWKEQLRDLDGKEKNGTRKTEE